MTNHETYLLSNLSAGQFIDLTPERGQNALDAARAFLSESGLAAELQHGFFVSVYPTATADDHDAEPGIPDAVAGTETEWTPAPAGESVTESREAAQTAGAAPDTESTDAPVSASSPLAAAAAQGPLHWTDDPEIDPPAAEKPSYIGIALDGTGR